VVSDNVMVSILRKELHREASNIANSICAAFFTTSSTETKKNWGFFADAVEEFR
jgi:hypothetical protein